MSSKQPKALVALTTPDEDPVELEALIAALCAELSPRTHLECRQVELIAHTDWEITRHRRQSAQLLTSETERQRNNAAKPDPMYSFLNGSVDHSPKAEGAPGTDRTPEFAALAYVKNFQFHAHHELSTERLEARRRQLLRDLQELQNRRERAAATDAEVVSE
jgi:hypothetical protein